jgi:hypothetical protein
MRDREQPDPWGGEMAKPSRWLAAREIFHRLLNVEDKPEGTERDPEEKTADCLASEVIAADVDDPEEPPTEDTIQ